MYAKDTNLLVISYCFYPAKLPRAIQALKILNQLAEIGCKIELVYADERSTNKIETKINPKLILNSSKPFPNKYLIEIAKRISKGGLTIPDTNYLWAKKRAKELIKIIDDNQTLLTISSPLSDHLIGLKMKQKLPTKKWIAFFSDPWTKNPYTFPTLSSYAKKQHLKLEKAVFENADALIFVSEQTQRISLKDYPVEILNKSFVIPHCFEQNWYPKECPANEKLKIVHTGSFYGKRNPLTLFKAINELIDEQKVDEHDIEILCVGTKENIFRQWVKEYKLDKIVKYGETVDYFESLEIMRGADVLLVVDAPADESLFLPSKLIDYLGSRRPIWAITPTKGATADLCRKTDNIVTNPNDLNEIKNQITNYIQLKKTDQLTDKQIDPLYKQFTSKKIAEQYLKVVEFVNRGSKK